MKWICVCRVLTRYFPFLGVQFWCWINSINFDLRIKLDSIFPFGKPHDFWWWYCFCILLSLNVQVFLWCNCFSPFWYFASFPQATLDVATARPSCRGLSARAPFQGRQKQDFYLPPPGTCTFSRPPAVLIITSIWGLLQLPLIIQLGHPTFILRCVKRIESEFCTMVYPPGG